MSWVDKCICRRMFTYVLLTKNEKQLRFLIIDQMVRYK